MRIGEPGDPGSAFDSCSALGMIRIATMGPVEDSLPPTDVPVRILGMIRRLGLISLVAAVELHVSQVHFTFSACQIEGLAWYGAISNLNGEPQSHGRFREVESS